MELLNKIFMEMKLGLAPWIMPSYLHLCFPSVPGSGQASATLNKHLIFSTKLSPPGAKKNAHFLFLLPHLPLTRSLQFGIYFYHNTEITSQRLLMMAELLLNPIAFMPCSLLPVCWHTLPKHFCLLMLGILYKLRAPQLFLHFTFDSSCLPTSWLWMSVFFHFFT